ncbi:MAG TPA: pantetheine-phosphate adenylyltransferase [Gammaproteobacteria bacterium]|nr:pantetheine-phosphate adenylyltransferase [Gammaproteobacteria bacterium]
MTQIAIFPGTFDPITVGHEDLIQRAASLFDQVIVAVAENVNKTPLFSLEQRIAMTRRAVGGNNKVVVKGFDNLLVQFAKQHKATTIVRGVRIATDFEYELQLSYMNRAMDGSIETIFLTPAEKHSYISSTLVKEIAKMHGDVTCFVNADVVEALKSITWP